MDKVSAALLLKKRKGQKPLSEGSSRRVYAVDDFVIKIPKNKRGQIECENEFWLYTHIDDSYKPYLCPVVYYDKKCLIMMKAEPVSKEDFESLFKKGITRVSQYLYQTYTLDNFDLTFNFNWGLLQGKLVVVDYGHHYFDEALSDNN